MQANRATRPHCHEPTELISHLRDFSSREAGPLAFYNTESKEKTRQHSGAILFFPTRTSCSNCKLPPCKWQLNTCDMGPFPPFLSCPAPHSTSSQEEEQSCLAKGLPLYFCQLVCNGRPDRQAKQGLAPWEATHLAMICAWLVHEGAVLTGPH